MRTTLSYCTGILFALALQTSASVHAQAGRNDATFNVFDDGTWGWWPNGPVLDAVQQLDGKVIVVGDIGGIPRAPRRGIGRMSLDGRVDDAFSSGDGFAGLGHPTGVALQADGRIVVHGDFNGYDGASRNRIARLLPNGDLDTSFDPGAGANARITDMAVQTDGRIVIVGEFLTVQGALRVHVARLLGDGTLDPTFSQPDVFDGPVHCVAVQHDGKVLIGGAFTTVGDVPRSCIARFNVDGTLDTTFDPGTGVTGEAPEEGAGPYVKDLLVQPDGNIVLVGAFNAYNGTPRGSIARLGAGGTLDVSYPVGGYSNREISTCDLRADGRLLLGGLFMDMGSGVAQLMPDGTRDPVFLPAFHTNSVFFARAVGDDKCIVAGDFANHETSPPHLGFEVLSANGRIHWPFTRTSGLNAMPWDILVQPDNKILVGGQFSRYNGHPVPRLIRLLPDGERDEAFPAGSGPNQEVKLIQRLSDGRIYIAGPFTAVNGVTCHRIARLNADGSLDGSFVPRPFTHTTYDPIHDMAVMSDGRLVVVGEFSAVDGMTRDCIVRFELDGSVDPTFAPTFTYGFSDPKLHAVEVSPAPSNKIHIGGDFVTVNGVARSAVARLNTNGTLDASFDPGAGAGDGSFIRLTLAPDDQLLVYGGIRTFDGETVDASVIRLLSDGTRDPMFFAPHIPLSAFGGGIGSSCQVNEVVITPSGRIVLCGKFLMDGDGTWNNVAGLLSNGMRDPDFSDAAVFGDEIFSMALQHNCCGGKAIIGGLFSEFDGAVRTRLARVGLDTGVRLFMDVILQAPWTGQLMDSDLRPSGYLPELEPFSGMGFVHVGGGGEQAQQSAFANQGPAEIVDWIFLELRNPQVPTEVWATRSALLCANGRIVDMDGLSSVLFKDVSNGAYFVAVRHRNHLPAMTAQPVIATQYGTTLDLTSPNVPLYGQDAMYEENGVRMLWAGDINNDGKIMYTGQGNDRDKVLSAIGGVIPTNSVTGYKVEDINLDGITRYTGSGNDRDIILRNIGGVVPTTVRQAQLP